MFLSFGGVLVLFSVWCLVFGVKKEGGKKRLTDIPKRTKQKRVQKIEFCSPQVTKKIKKIQCQKIGWNPLLFQRKRGGDKKRKYVYKHNNFNQLST